MVQAEELEMGKAFDLVRKRGELVTIQVKPGILIELALRETQGRQVLARQV